MPASTPAPVHDDGPAAGDPRDRAALDLLLEAVQQRPQVMRATGDSMAPTIPSGTMLELSALTGPARCGDVVAAFNHADEFMIHRVVGLDAHGRVLLKPDGLPWVDGWVAAEGVRAKVTRLCLDGVWKALPRGAGATVLAPYARVPLLRLWFDRVRSRLFGE